MSSVAAGNRDMAAAWDGDEGAHWAAHADGYERSATPYREHLLDAAALRPGEHVLDIGCGAGRTTRDAARAVGPDGSALGLDLSGAMLERAAQTACDEGLVNVQFAQADAQVHPFAEASYDVVISQFGSMFFADPVAAFRNVGAAMNDSGRMLLLVWQGLEANPWANTIRTVLAAGRELPTPPPGAPGPFSMADPDRPRQLLADAGFADVAVENVACEFNIGADAAAAFAFVRGMGVTRSLLADLDPARQESALAELQSALDSRETPAGVVFPSAAWLVTAHR